MPFGGVTWQALQHLVALRRLGFDVWYVEESQCLVLDPVTQSAGWDCEGNVAYLAHWMDRVGLGDRWMFRQPGPPHALIRGDERALAQVYAEADAAFNLCGAQEPLETHRGIRRRVYLQTDPVQEQVLAAQGDVDVLANLDRYDHLFTYGENLDAADCAVPIVRYRWRPTRPPVLLDWWDVPGAAHRPVLTTVATWQHTGKDVVWNGQPWHWSKDREFQRFAALPSRSRWPLEIALGHAPEEAIDRFTREGWHLVPPISDPEEYRRYLIGSGGEFTAAKEQYVAPRSGWFSDRSATYLAAGRPVVTQDTGFGKFVPTGKGLFAFSTLDEAAAAIDAIATDYARHSAAARELAREYFDAERVLGRILQDVGLL